MNNTIKIPFKGITRNTDDQMSSDGECMELINARIANGSVEPVNNPILIKTLGEAYKKIYYHQKADRYIALKSDKTIVCITSDLSTVTALSTDLIGVIEISFIGLIACVLTESGIKYMRWKAGNYLYLGEIPELPEIFIGYETKASTEVISNPPTLDESNSESCKAWSSLVYGGWLKAMDNLNEQGYFLHSSCFRIAFRLYDGSYIKHSPVRCILPNGEVSSGISGIDTAEKCSFGAFKKENKYVNNTSTKNITFASIGFKPTFSYSPIDLSVWKDLIVGIDIFASISMRDYYRGYRTDFKDDERVLPIDAIKEVAEFYKIASIDLSGILSYPKGSVKPSSLVLNPQLSDDNLTHNALLPKKSYVYNSRLHIFEIETIAYAGYGKDYLYDSTKQNATGTDVIDVYVYINTEDGMSIVNRQFVSSYPSKITSYLMYPDSRAYKMVIRITSGSTKRIKEFSLKAHSKINAAYYFESETLIDTSTWSTTDISIVPNVIKEKDNSKLKVSGLNNPFYFPPRTTYQLPSDIIAVQSNAVALSQGQFGQFPLYAFCKDGIYAMQVSTGDVVYASIAPVSRDICTNPNICGIDTSVIFVTDRGLMSIDGAQTQCISESLDGYLPSCFNSSPVLSKILKIANLDDRVSTLIFNDYLKEANIGYNYADSEIIVSNNTCTYSYIFNLKSGQWHKISHKIDSFINAYPNTLIVEGETIYNPFNPHRSISKIALVTRPIKLGSTTHKRLFQVALRSIIKRALSDLYLRGEPVQYRGEDLTIFSDLGFYILGSEDGEHFSFLVGRESLKDIRDLVTKANKTKACKSFIVCLVGGVRSDVSINYLEMIAEEAFGNRLR